MESAKEIPIKNEKLYNTKKQLIKTISVDDDSKLRHLSYLDNSPVKLSTKENLLLKMFYLPTHTF